MNHIRSNLTRLKKRIQEKFPDGSDIYGYPGVSKDEVVKYLEDAYGLTSRLEELRDQFPVTILKRTLSPLISECRKFADDEVEGKNSKDKFDKFLRSLTEIHDEIYLSYVIHCSDAIRSESELEGIIKQIKVASNTYDSNRDEIARLVSSLEKIRELEGNAENSAGAVTEAEEGIESAKQRINELVAETEASAKIVTKYESETKDQKQSVINLLSEMKGSEEKVKSLIGSSEKQKLEIQRILKSADDLLKKNEHHQTQVAQTLRAASRFGMAASFKQRKDELRWSMLTWGVAFVAAVAGIFATGIFYVLPHFEQGEIPKVWEVLVKVTLISPLVWLGWMSARQYSYLSRIREDYSFKYASALAFEGYKSEATTVDPELLKQLLAAATDNMALNPLRIYGDESAGHASPAQELIARIKGNQKAGDREGVKADQNE